MNEGVEYAMDKLKPIVVTLLVGIITTVVGVPILIVSLGMLVMTTDGGMNRFSMSIENLVMLFFISLISSCFSYIPYVISYFLLHKWKLFLGKIYLIIIALVIFILTSMTVFS